MDALLEGVLAAAQPCSLALVVPGAAATLLAGRWGGWAALSYLLFGVAAAWTQAGELVPVGVGVRTGAVLAGVALAGAWTLLRGHPRLPAAASAIAGGAAVGVAAGLLWQPCVGPALGRILTAALSEPLAQLGPLLLYGTGLLASTALVAALPHLHPRASAAVRSAPARAGATAVLVALAVVLATGQYAVVIGALVRASDLG